MRRRAALTWLLRLAVLAGVVLLLVNQLRWWDALHLADGREVVGAVEALGDGGWRVTTPDGDDVRFAASEVARHEAGADGEAVPAVSWGLRTVLGRLARRWPAGLLVLGLLGGALAITIVRWWLLMRAVALGLGLARTLRLGWIGAFFNLAVPGSTGGDVVKAYYAARLSGHATRAVISVFMDRVLGLFGLALLAGGALLVAPAGLGEGPARTAALAVVLAGVLGAALLLVPAVRRSLGLSALARRLPFATLWSEAATASRLYRDHPRALGAAVLISVANHLVAAVAVWVVARALGVAGVGLPACLVLVPVANLVSAIPLVPGGWGIGELAFAWLFGQVGVAPTEAIALSVVYRASLLAVSLPGAPLWIVWGDRTNRASIAQAMEDAGRPGVAPPPDHDPRSEA